MGFFMNVKGSVFFLYDFIYLPLLFCIFLNLLCVAIFPAKTVETLILMSTVIHEIKDTYLCLYRSTNCEAWGVREFTWNWI